MTLRYCQCHALWNTLKIVLRLVSIPRVFARGGPEHRGSTPKGTPQLLARIITMYWKKWFSSHKTRSISETAEDRAKVTNGLYKVVHELSIAAKMCDLEWPLSESRWSRLASILFCCWIVPSDVPRLYQGCYMKQCVTSVVSNKTNHWRSQRGADGPSSPANDKKISNSSSPDLFFLINPKCAKIHLRRSPYPSRLVSTRHWHSQSALGG